MTARPTPRDACSWCGHAPHATACPNTITAAAALAGVRLPRRYGGAVETIPCPCQKENPR